MPAALRDLADEQIRNSPRRLVRIIDYVVVAAHDHGGGTPAGHEGAIGLPNGVRIVQLDHALAERLFDASALRGENWHPTRQFHAVHAYMRDVWVEGCGEAPLSSHWDHDHYIWPVVQLSRLIRDNNVSTEFAIRRLVRADQTERLIPFSGFESHVIYRLYPDQRGWLDVDEARQLAGLVDAYLRHTALSLRVRRALRRADAITGERYLENAMPLVVGALEALLKVGRDYAGAQFAQRVPALAAESGVTLSVEECRTIYDDRSALVHGGDVDLSVAHQLDDFGAKFNALQETLRRTVRHSLESPQFAKVFDNDADISARWPTVVKRRRGGDLRI